MSERAPASAPQETWLSADRIGALLFLALIALYAWDSSRLVTALEVDIIGPSFFPKILATLGLILALIVLVRPAPRKKQADAARWLRADLTALAPALLLLCYVLVFESIGFPIATAVFLTLAFRYLKHPRWLSAFALGIAVTVATYALFVYALGLKLPLGLLAKLG